MTSSDSAIGTARFRVEKFSFDDAAIRKWALDDGRHDNWPVVYTITNDREIYVGETRRAATRMREHRQNPKRHGLTGVRVVLDTTFNKSACTDFESFLIRYFGGDGKFRVQNVVTDMTDYDYYDKVDYQAKFQEIFDYLKDQEELFSQTRLEIENSDLFKLSPYKALTDDQRDAVGSILIGLFRDLELGDDSLSVVQGDPGTGKTIVAIYLMKLLSDIQREESGEDLYSESPLAEFLDPEFAHLLDGFRMGLVVPQQSLRESIKRVFKKVPGLSPDMVLDPFTMARDPIAYDLLIVDEAHRLSRRANQSSGKRNKLFADITNVLFSDLDDDARLRTTQLDWVRAKSRHQVFLLDSAQSVRPMDVPVAALAELAAEAARHDRFHALVSQLRVVGGADYIEHVRAILAGKAPDPIVLPKGYEFRLFEDLGELHDELRARDAEHGLARLVAGFAWEWKSKGKKNAHEVDIELDGRQLQWNKTDKDWINSPGSIDQVGSIYTVQGYDLNYAGVIVGPELGYDPTAGRLVFNRKSYFDTMGKQNNRQLGITFTDDDLLQYVTQIYTVLLTRGVKGTYVYVCDDALRERFRAAMGSGGC